MDVFIKAAEYMEMPVRRSDDEPLQKLFVAVRSELNLDLKNIKTEQAKFWKQHPSLVKVGLYWLDSMIRKIYNDLHNLKSSTILNVVILLQMELLIQAHLTCESFALTPVLLKDYRHMLELAPRLLEELVKVLIWMSCSLDLSLILF